MVNKIKKHFSKVVFLSALLVLASFSLSSAVENHNSSRSNKTYPLSKSDDKEKCVKNGGKIIGKKDKNGKIIHYCQPKNITDKPGVGIKEEGVK